MTRGHDQMVSLTMLMEPRRAVDEGAGQAPEGGAGGWWLRGSIAILSH